VVLNTVSNKHRISIL